MADKAKGNGMQRMKRTATVLAVVLSCSAFAAQAQWRDQNGNVLPQSPTQNHDKDFGAMLQVSTRAEAERFRQEWHSTGVEHAPNLTLTETARRGDEVSISLVYAGCGGKQPAATCDATASITVFKPDGSVYGDFQDLSLANGQPPVANVLQLSPLEIVIRFEPQDPFGTYRIVAKMHDPAQDANLELRNEIALTELATTESSKD